MNGTYDGVKAEGVRRVNRSCAIAIHMVLTVCAAASLIGFSGAWAIEPEWMYFYLVTIVLPLLAIAVYAKKRDYRGERIRQLMVLAASLVPAALSVPTLMGFLLMPLPIVVAGRYFSRRFVWTVYLMTLVLTLAMMPLHARFGTPSYPLCDEARESLRRYVDGRFERTHYLWYLVVCCLPSYAVFLSFFALNMSCLCTDHLDMLERQARVSARLADVEKGLVLAVAAQVATGNGQCREDRPQPDVADCSTQAIASCIAKVKRRAAEDPAFAALVERDPAAAVKEVQT